MMVRRPRRSWSMRVLHLRRGPLCVGGHVPVAARAGYLSLVLWGLSACGSAPPPSDATPWPVPTQWNTLVVAAEVDEVQAQVQAQAQAQAALQDTVSWGARQVDETDTDRLQSPTWQRYFLDERLRGVVDLALRRNRDLQVAAHNLEAARAVLLQSRAARRPSVKADWASEEDWEGDDALGEKGWTRSHQLGLTVAWELDLFGHLSAQSEERLQRYLASEAGWQAVQVSLVASTAQAYLQWATDLALLALAQSTQVNAQGAAALTQERLTRGMANRQDVLVQQTLAHQARADALRYQRLCAQDRNALELLIGGTLPAEWAPDELLEAPYSQVAWPEDLDTRVLLVRPDVAQAEHQLQATAADVAAARAAFFPVIRLGLESGGLADTIHRLLSTPTRFLNWTMDATWPLFSGGALQAREAQTRALQQAALAQYEKVVQTAFREVADAMAARVTLGPELQARQSQLDALVAQQDIVHTRHRLGRDGALSVLDIDRQVYAARAAVLQSRLALAVNGVDLYRGLGGGAS